MGVTVQEEDWIPAKEDILHQPRSFRALQLHPISVQIEILPIVPDSHASCRAHLVGPVLRADLLISIRIEVRADEDDQTIQVGSCGTLDDVPGQHEGGLFPLHLPCVDVGLNVYHRPIVEAEILGEAGTGSPITMTGKGLPSALTAMVSTRMSGLKACSSETKSRTSEWREVCWKPVASATVGSLCWPDRS